MIHPFTEVRFVSNEIGYGVFATESIPLGTIVYVKDPLEINITPELFAQFSDDYQNVIEKYSYIDNNGVRVISWDHGKYVNHRCECNSISTGYGFEIAIRDIAEDEEITDEYGLFNVPYPFDVACTCRCCRKRVLPSDIETYYHAWDQKIINAIGHLLDIPQPLWDFMDSETKNDIIRYIQGEDEYRSVLSLQFLHDKKRSAS